MDRKNLSKSIMGGDKQEEETCDTWLSLRLGSGGFALSSTVETKRKASRVQLNLLFPLNPKEETVDDDHTSTRKKLRLTKEQANLLETSFKQHNALNMMQKQELAERLDLRPRQVEVWFQNRRARTKLKKTEVDCEVMKKLVERLNEENRRLKKDLQDLKSAKFGPSSSSPFYPHHLPENAAALTMCPKCGNKSSSEGNKHNIRARSDRGKVVVIKSDMC